MIQMMNFKHLKNPPKKSCKSDKLDFISKNSIKNSFRRKQKMFQVTFRYRNISEPDTGNAENQMTNIPNMIF